MYKIITSILFLIMFSTFLSANEKVTLQLAWKHQWQFAGYYMAKEKGFYSDAGLDVNIKEFDLNVNITDDVVEGRTDFGVGRSSLIHDRAQGKPVVMLDAILQHSPVILLAKKRKDLKTVYDLKNKRIMLTKDQIGMASINAMLYSNGIQPGMYKQQEHTFNVNDLIEDKTDALLAYISNEPYAMQEKGIDYRVFSPKEYNFDFYSDILFTSEKLLKNNPALVEKFTQASLHGWEYAIKHPEETTALILEKYNTQKRTKGALSFESKAIIKLTDYGLIPLGNINQKRIEYITQIYRLMGLIKGDFSLDNFIYNVKLEKKKNDIGLSESELKWIKSNVVKIGVEQWAPVVYSNTGKDIDGIAGDFMKLIIERTGLRTTVINDKWDTLLNEFKEKKIDILPATYYTDERATYGNYSKGYFKMKDYLYVKENTKGLTSLDEMHGKTLAIIKGYGTIDKIKKTYPNIKLLLTDSLGSSIDAVLQGKADALYEGGVAVEYFMKKELISGLKGFPQSKFKTPELYFFTLPEKQILSSIIQKGLQSITPEERIKIISKWHKKNDQQQLQSQQLEIKLGDILPIKEILIAVFILIIITIILFRYLSKKKEVNLGITMFIIVSLFLLFTVFTTVLSISNIERVQKQEIKDSLTTLANITNKALNEWYISQNKMLHYTTQNSPYLRNISELVSHEKDVTYLKENQYEVKKHYENIKKSFEDTSSFFIISKDNIILSASKDALIGSKIKQDFVTQEIKEVFSGKEAYIHPKVDKNDKYHFFRHLYFLTPLFNKDTHEVIAVYAIAIKSNSMTNIANAGRMGQSGETYVINRHAELISNSRFDKELQEQGLIKKNQKSFLNLTVSHEGKHTLAASEVLKEKNGFNVDGYKDYRGVTVLGAWRWDKVLHFGIITEIDQSEAMSSFQHLRNAIYAVVFSIVGFVILLMLFIVWVSNKNRKNLGEKNLQLEEFSKSLEQKVEDRTKDLTEEKKLFQALFNAAPDGIVLISQEGKFEDCNKASVGLFGVESRKELLGSNPANLSPEFQLNGQKSAEIMKEKIGIAMQKGKAHFEWLHMRPNNHEIFFAEVILAPFMYQGNGLIYAIVRDISDRKEAENKLAVIHKHTRESIEYASLIQHALIPDNKTFQNYFQDYFTIWHPKDTVGGDVYLFEELRNKDECLLMVIDCTGHGVPGAFVTMLVKAIERQVTAKINNSDEVVSPAKVLSIFNKNMKQLLKQESVDSVSNAGFDGGIIYYNKKEKILKFAGAETPLFYVEDDELKTIKGNRYSVGYKKCDIDYEYKEHTLEVKEGMQFYLTTDGYLDQNGGVKGFPFGKKAFKKIIEEYHTATMADQQEVFLNELDAYQGEEDRNDDVTLVGFKI